MAYSKIKNQLLVRNQKVNNLIYIKSYLLFYERPHKLKKYISRL
jgi:hypothetical protein